MTDKDWTVEIKSIDSIKVGVHLDSSDDGGGDLIATISLSAHVTPDEIREIAKMQLCPTSVTAKFTTAQIPMFGKQNET